MAASAITVVDVPATIESDATGAVITNGEATYGPGCVAELRNHGPADVWLYISQASATPALTSDVVTTNAQAQKIAPLPAGSSLPIFGDYKTIAHKTAAGTATLSWVPQRARY